MKLTIKNSTTFKLAPVQSSGLPSNQKVAIAKGTVFQLQSHAPAPNNHVKVAIANAFLGPENRNTWYVYAPDIAIAGNEPNNEPKNETIAPRAKTDLISLPGYQSRFSLSSPILASGHFTWAEATKNGSRIPADRDVVDGIMRIAKVLEAVRSRLGDRPISINSWYRDPATNRAVGGASQSRHLVGDAVDFVVVGLHPSEVYARLDLWWGNRGGLASSTVFTHLDVRGYEARWSYGF